MRSPRPRRWGSVAIRTLVSLGVLAWFTRAMDWEEVVALWSHLHPGWVAAGLVVSALLRFLSTMKWRLLLAQKGMRFPYGDLLHVVWVSTALGQFLPAGVGGDNFRMLAMVPGSRRGPEIVSTIVMERLLGITALAGLAVFGGLWFYGKWNNPDVALSLIAPLGLVLLVLALLWTDAGYRLISGVFARARVVPGRVFFSEVHEAVLAYRHHPRALARLLGLSLASQLDRVFEVFVLALAMGLGLSLGGALVLVPTALFIAMLPISIGGWGVREGAFVVLLRLAGLDAVEALSLSLLSRLVNLVVDLPGLWLFVTQGLGRDRVSASHAAMSR